MVEIIKEFKLILSIKALIMRVSFIISIYIQFKFPFTFLKSFQLYKNDYFLKIITQITEKRQLH